MKLSKKILPGLALAATLTASMSAAGCSRINTFTEGQFVDVPADEWYASEIADAYELGLMQGVGEGRFDPAGSLTVAEAITVASRAAARCAGETIPEAGGEWYQAYVNYALSKGFVTDGQFAAEDYVRFAKRREVAALFFDALPDDWFTEKNDVTEIPDVRGGLSYSENVLKLYKAGVLMGSDSYGNFRPEDGITRAETAAIISRVVLPEKRLSGKLDKYAHDDAFVLHNSYTDGSSRGMEGYKEGISSGWQLDNRGGSPRTSLFDSYGTLSDVSTEEGTAMIREFNNMTGGLIKLESRFTVSKENDGVYLEYVNAAGDPIYRVETEGNAWYYMNADGSRTKLCEFAAPDLSFAFDITVDLDNDRSTTYINYETVGTLPLITSGDATNMQSFRYGTTEKSTAVISCTNINIVGNYAAYDDFDWDNGKLPFDWEGENFTARYTLDIAAEGSAIRPFVPVSGTVVAESEFNTAEGEPFDIIMRSGIREIVRLSYDGTALYADGEKIYDTLVPGLWYDFRVEADTDSQTAMIRLNGIKRGEVPFAAASTSIDNVRFINRGEKNFTIDNLHVFEKIFHEDYVPTPVIPKGEEKYNVGLNVCSLWTNGTHFGWSCVSPFDDLEPVLGYYDEGSAELADWEIKYMVEHGIDFQAFCWYPGETDSAIKNTRQGTALRLGYKNAEYSDMMKYCLIWECANASMPKGLDAWKQYYVPYLIEHYFKDPRYMTIDNRPLLYIFGASNLAMDPDTGSKQCGFGSVRNVKAGFDYLNGELAKIGLGEVIVVASHAGSSAELKAMGIEATAAYNWGSDGYTLSVNTSGNEKNASDTNCFTIPTISIGFNNVSWAQTRYPLMSAADFKEANLWARDEFSPKYAKEDWQKNLFHISTWNEYGEGTCIMPMRGGDTGFGYLDALREVFTDEKADPSVNTVPTAEQLRRITHRYPQHLHLLRKQGFFKEEDKIDYSSLTVVKTYDMTSYPMDRLNFIRIENTVQNGSGISGTTNGSDPIVILNDTDGPDLDDAKYLHIRMAIPEDELIEMYFTTADSENWEQSKGSAVRSTSGDMTDYYLDLSGNGKWKGTLQYLRIDPGSAGGHSFTLECVELMSGKTPAAGDRDIFINDQKVTMQLPPQISSGGDYLVAFDPFIAMDFRLNAFHTWDKSSGVLTLMLNKHTVVYTVGSDSYTLDGKEKELGFKLETLDGLPLIPLEMLCRDVGYRFEINDRGVCVETNEIDFFSAAEARVPCQWEFNVDGDTEGWKSSLMSLLVSDGYLSAASITDSTDPTISLSGIEFDAARYNRIEYRVRYDYNPRYTEKKDENGNVIDDHCEIAEALTMYFATDSEPGLSESKTIKLMLKDHTSNGEWEVYEGEINNEKWDGKITQLRFDPFNAVGTCDVDYIRFIEDPNY